MPTPMDDSSRELVKRILLAPSQNDVIALINTVLNALEQNQTELLSILDFIDTTIRDIEALDAMQIDPVQWSNTKMGRLILNRRKRLLHAHPSYQC
jgi:hypothetical protein